MNNIRFGVRTAITDRRYFYFRFEDHIGDTLSLLKKAQDFTLKHFPNADQITAFRRDEITTVIDGINVSDVTYYSHPKCIFYTNSSHGDLLVQSEKLFLKVEKPSVTTKIIALLKRFDKQFLKPEIYTRLTVSQIENDYHEVRFAEQGDENLEAHEKITATYKNVSLCRLSASGYTDCTDWDLCYDENDILEWLEREAESLP